MKTLAYQAYKIGYFEILEMMFWQCVIHAIFLTKEIIGENINLNNFVLYPKTVKYGTS